MTGASRSAFSAVRMCHSGEATTAAQSASLRFDRVLEIEGGPEGVNPLQCHVQLLPTTRPATGLRARRPSCQYHR